jgi:hypothetical protein
MMEHWHLPHRRVARLALAYGAAAVIVGLVPQLRFFWPLFIVVISTSGGFETACWLSSARDGLFRLRKWRQVLAAVRRKAYGELGLQAAALVLPLVVLAALAGRPAYIVPVALVLAAVLAFAFIDLGLILALLFRRAAQPVFAVLAFILTLAVMFPNLPGAKVLAVGSPVYYFANAIYRAAYGYAQGGFWPNAVLLLVITFVIASAKTFILNTTWRLASAPARRRRSRATGRR